MDVLEKLELLRGMLCCCHRLDLLTYTGKMQPISDIPVEISRLQDVFDFKKYAAAIAEHAEKHCEPLIITNRIGLTWVAGVQEHDGTAVYIQLFGPLFIYSFPTREVEAELSRRNLSVSHRQSIMKSLRELPVISLSCVTEYALMLHYCLTGEALTVGDIRFYGENEQTAELPKPDTASFHGTYEVEQEMTRMVREGNLNYRALINRLSSTGNVGNISDGNPLRQLKNMIIVNITLFSRAAMEGGLPPETAYTVSDQYYQAVEKSSSMSEITDINMRMQDEFVHRVHQHRHGNRYTKTVAACMDQIRFRLEDDLPMREIAKQQGYSEEYLNKKFQCETGMTIREYQKEERLNRSKFLLETTQLSVQDISARLRFGSPSYFTNLFRLKYGMTPTEYRKKITLHDEKEDKVLRKTVNWNSGWLFKKNSKEIPISLPEDWEPVDLPHTWNGTDGQDGGNNYFRGICLYAKLLTAEELPHSGQCWLELNGANSSAEVYVNGEMLKRHDGGYSTWRVNLTDSLTENGNDLIIVVVDNSPNPAVYPQMADFTFYGGLYRDVRLVYVPESHFELDHYGGCGIKVTPSVHGDRAVVEINTFVTNTTVGQSIEYTVLKADGTVAASCVGIKDSATLELPNVHLWDGRRDPYLYTARVRLLEAEVPIDEVSARFGCRSIAIDPNKGFILNGRPYPLRGVSRHQDRLCVGNALTREHHLEDMDLICEMGANTVRLAHYQHDQIFYDLCDERGIVVWAEIPYISMHRPEGRENTMQQMRELIVQNYNHPSIVVWGLSNEITMNGPDDPDLLENHRILNDMCHAMDKTRLTTMAILSKCDPSTEYARIPDVIAYNHYFGWYNGEASMIGPWFDRFHAQWPDRAIGLSEYGCEALNWHSSKPKAGDYTEEYQAAYHEEMIRQISVRPYIWGTWVWNMFDFGADSRNEGGENGQNHKGLVTIDRKYKKDSFYAYKAWLSDEPFVHICGKRYVDRVENVTKVTVYSNLPEVELFANGISLGKLTTPDHFFYFNVPNSGVTRLTAAAGECRDESEIHKVETFNEKYRLREKTILLNWYEVSTPEGFYSLNDKLGDIMRSEAGKQLFLSLADGIMAKGGGSGRQVNENMMAMLGDFTFLNLLGMMSSKENALSRDQLLELNEKLNHIPKSAP